jgi:hypothetical protein
VLSLVGSHESRNRRRRIIQGDSKLLPEFPFIGHGNPDNNFESPCIFYMWMGDFARRVESDKQCGVMSAAMADLNRIWY